MVISHLNKQELALCEADLDPDSATSCKLIFSLLIMILVSTSSGLRRPRAVPSAKEGQGAFRGLAEGHLWCQCETSG